MGQGGGHEVQPQPAEDFVDPAEGLQCAGQPGPQRPPRIPARIPRIRIRAGGGGILQQAQHAGGEDGTQRHLPLDADVPQPGGESDQHAGSGQQQRRPGDQQVFQVVGRTKRAA